MITADPFRRVRTSTRLWVAAALSVAPMGFVWSHSGPLLLPGGTLFGDCGYSTGPYCTPDVQLPGVVTPGSTTLVDQAPVHVFLVVAALGFVLAALYPRTAGTRQIARIAVAALAVAFVYAASQSDLNVAGVLAVGLALSAPPVWRRAPPPGPVRTSWRVGGHVA